MVYIKPFKALRPKEDLVSKVNSPPYDIVSQEEARLIVDNNPYSFLNVVKPEVTTIKARDVTNQQLAERLLKNSK